MTNWDTWITPVQIAIYGASGFGREVEWVINAANEGEREIACYIDDAETLHGSFIHGIPVMALSEAFQRFPDALVVGAIGSPQVREVTISKAFAAGFASSPALKHPSVEYYDYVAFGDGSVICAGVKLTTEVVIGQHVHLNLNSTVGHDVIIGDFTTIAPLVGISGCVQIGRGVTIGTGAVIRNGTQEKPLTIGDGAVIGMGSVVTKDVAPGVTVMGNPARPRE